MSDDAAGLKAQLQAVTGGRIAALEAVGDAARKAEEKAAGADKTGERRPGCDAGPEPGKDRHGPVSSVKDRETPAPERGGSQGMDIGL